MRIAPIAALLFLTACRAPDPMTVTPARAPVRVAPGLTLLPCDGSGLLRPEHPGFCRLGRAYVTAPARQALVDVAAVMARKHPGSMVLFMDASGPSGRKPFPPHLSHGDGREVDLAVFYRTTDGRPLSAPPEPNRYGYGDFEPPRPGDPLPCHGRRRPGDTGDPPATRAWRLDEARTGDLARALIGDPRVRRILLEPHLKARLGLRDRDKVRFAGCWAARHDDHIHVDFY